MKRMRHGSAVLACAIGLGFSGLVQATAFVTVRARSINDALRDFETIAASTHDPFTQKQALGQLAAFFGVEDLSFLDLSKPAAFAIPQEGMALGPGGIVMAIPVRDGLAALDVLAKQFSERTLDGDLTVLRHAPVVTPGGTTQQSLYAALRGRVLVLGQNAELVRSFDHASALSGENLPPGSLAFSLEVEPVAALLKGGLFASRQRLMQVPAPASGPATASPTPTPAPAAKPTPTPEMETQGNEPILVTGDVTPPRLLVKVQPEYPEAARRAHAEGKVILEAVINTDGEIENVKVLRSVPLLDDPAIDAVRQWKYEPASLHGQPVKVYFTVIVEFNLRNPDPGEASAASAPGAAEAPFPYDPKKVAGLFDLVYGLLNDEIDSTSKLQVSIEVSDGFLIVHARGVARQGSTLAGFIAAQRNAGLPAIGRMMPAHASVLVAGQVNWTDASRAWAKQLMQRYESAMREFLKVMPESARGAEDAFVRGVSLWGADRIIDCERGDLALAMDYDPGDARMLQVWGVSDAQKCKGVLASMIATAKTEVLDPEKVTTYTYQVPFSKTTDADGTIDSEELKVRFAQIGDTVILGTDDWASEAIREAASAGERSTPGSGGLILADLGPFTQGPGVFGRIQLGTLMRQAEGALRANETGHPEPLIQALEGPAGSIPFAMRFDEGAATLELALPLAMFEAFAANAPKPAPPSP